MTILPSNFTSAYNSLRDVAAADALLKAQNGETIIRELLRVINRHGLARIVGVRLLHRHNSIASGETMVADHLFDADGFGVATRAVAGTSREVVANSWQLTNLGFIPSEFSMPHLVEGPAVNPETQSALFSDLAVVLRQFGVADLLGISLNNSFFVDAQRGHDSDVLLEETDYDDRANIIRFRPFGSVGTSTVETSWAAEIDENLDVTMAPRTTCTMACSVFPKGGHQGTKVHIQK